MGGWLLLVILLAVTEEIEEGAVVLLLFAAVGVLEQGLVGTAEWKYVVISFVILSMLSK